MRAHVWVLGAAFALAACGEDGHGVDSLLVTQDNASDEALHTLLDAEQQGLVTTDAAKAAVLVTPGEGAALPRAMPALFSWSAPPLAAGKHPRHGVDSGWFVWVRLTEGGLARPVDVLSIDTLSWTPDAAAWAAITAATSTVTVTITTAYLGNGVIESGPFIPGTPSSFTIAP